MIQTPQLQYIPAQQPIPDYYQQPACSPVQYTQTQYPGVIYNYPTSSCYAPAQTTTGKSQFNGVNIEIINPQGQGVAPGQMNTPAYVPAQTVVPAQYIPPQQPVIQYPGYMPYPASQAIVQAPPMAPLPQFPQAGEPQVVTNPQPYIPATPFPGQPYGPQPINSNPVPPPEVINPNAQTPGTPVIDNNPIPEVNTTNIKPEVFAGRLQTDDLNKQSEVIEEIANIVLSDDEAGKVLVDTQIFDALVDIINKDTSALEGPSEEIIALREKPEEELTEEELQKAKTPSPLEQAEINKLHAIYTIAFMQGKLNDELIQINDDHKPLDMPTLPCIETIVDTVKDNPNPNLRVGAISALGHIAKPEYKEDLKTIFELALNDEDQRVKDAAQNALNNLQSI